MVLGDAYCEFWTITGISTRLNENVYKMFETKRSGGLGT